MRLPPTPRADDAVPQQSRLWRQIRGAYSTQTTQTIHQITPKDVYFYISKSWIANFTNCWKFLRLKTSLVWRFNFLQLRNYRIFRRSSHISPLADNTRITPYMGTGPRRKRPIVRRRQSPRGPISVSAPGRPETGAPCRTFSKISHCDYDVHSSHLRCIFSTKFPLFWCMICLYWSRDFSDIASESGEAGCFRRFRPGQVTWLNNLCCALGKVPYT